jgi:hypothetical protein
MTRTRAIERLVIAAALFSVSMISGCYVRVHPNLSLYPVRGPLTTEKPVREAHVRFTAHATFTPVYIAASKSGDISATLGDGEICKGRWRLLSTPSDNPIASDWDTIYGQGFYVAEVLGSRQYLQAELTGNRGTTLHVEMYWPQVQDRDAVVPGKGVATDNHGNVYKITQ